MTAAKAEPKLERTNPSDQMAAARAAAKEPCLQVLWELARTYQAFITYDEENIRKLGLTLPQFDVIATLGNTPGMTMNVLAEKTLVTKGTLTGIVDRLEKKGLVRREVPPEDRRCFVIVLTPEGERVFEEVFPNHIAYLKQRFDRLQPQEAQEILASLQRLREIF
ncbi:MarR family transcriptional regulator [Leptolyngbya sp. 'hensonii']|uniref:MarR family winged helix-turn-helix transcriptional regulator n=1 Tax=Leptolyngbya sp. 'hensonii' TaxID=1922337 RepID=UPI000AC9884B|nr:MarR family transcriptional regulator [Leptolyngbya sp. 'hensonii']